MDPAIRTYLRYPKVIWEKNSRGRNVYGLGNSGGLWAVIKDQHVTCKSVLTWACAVAVFVNSLQLWVNSFVYFPMINNYHMFTCNAHTEGCESLSRFPGECTSSDWRRDVVLCPLFILISVVYIIHTATWSVSIGPQLLFVCLCMWGWDVCGPGAVCLFIWSWGSSFVGEVCVYACVCVCVIDHWFM